MENLRYKLYQLIDYTDTTGDGKKNIDYYDLFMLVIIILSLIPLLFKTETPLFIIIEIVTTSIFILDYFLRWSTADIRLQKKGMLPFLIYPFTLLAIIDLFTILPGFSALFPASQFFTKIRALKVLRLIRLVKLMRYSQSIDIIFRILHRSKSSLLTVGSLAIGYILVSSIVIFNVEPDSFTNFYEALYWATMSLAAVGYGDLYPVSTAGRLIAMLSSFFGIAIVALPAGIITAGYMKEIQENESKEAKR